MTPRQSLRPAPGVGRYLVQVVGHRLILLFALGLASAIGTSVQVYTTSSLVSAGTISLGVATGIWLGTLVALVTVDVATQWIVTDAALQVRMDLARRVTGADIRTIERTGIRSLVTAAMDDVGQLTSAISALPLIGTNILIVAGSFTYLFHLSTRLAFIQLGAAALTVLLAVLPFQRSVRATNRSATARAAFNERMQLTIAGHKELKLDFTRRRWTLFEALPKVGRTFRDSVRRAMGWEAVTSAITRLSAFLVVSVTSLVGRHLGESVSTLTTFALTTFFLIGPVSAVIGLASEVAAGQAALRRIRSTGMSMDQSEEERQTTSRRASFRRIDLEGVRFSYGDASRRFQLGPIDLTVEAGSIVFIAGGNGSGKTTLSRVLAGLYAPTEGELSCDGEPIDDLSRDSYRQLWTAVFADFCLFPEIASGGDFDLDRAQSLLEDMGLAKIVSIEDGRFSTTALSTGQRKRLALISAILRDPPAFLFDEWAADQDPSFRRTFYRKILPDLKARGKAVVAVTHDEAYFDSADVIVKLEDGMSLSESTRAFMVRLTGARTAGPSRPPPR